MKLAVQLLVIACVLLAVFSQTTTAAKGPCMGCTIVLSVLEQLAAQNKVDMAGAVTLWCNALTNEDKLLSAVCIGALSPMATSIQEDFDAGKSPDWTCANTMKMCVDDETKCQLWKSGWPYGPKNADGSIKLETTPRVSYDAASPEEAKLNKAQRYFFEFLVVLMRLTEPSTEFANAEPIDFLTSLTSYPGQPQFAKQYMETIHLAALQNRVTPNPNLNDEGKWFLKAWVDNDKDGHSSFAKLRGADWRGKDCDDNDAEVYPGRNTAVGKSHDVDHNCNGISGSDPTTGRSYEEMWCTEQTNYGIVALGDSATAGFALPPCWLTPSCIVKKGSYAGLLDVVMNEADWPMCSAYTGFDAASCPSLATSMTPFSSIYKYARDRNPCMHRSFHNIGVNGARSTSYNPGPKNDGIITSFKRDAKHDNPVIVFFQLIGNDVCNKNSSVASMTSEADFYNSYRESLQYLDEQLPPGSVVFLGGLVDGRLLYDTMWNKVHPGGMKYLDFYNFLNCHDTSPCSGWLNEDPAIRDATTEHARKLSRQLERLVNDEKNSHANYKLYYNDIEGMIKKIFDETVAAGFDPIRLVEAVDSFHPSSTTLSLLSKELVARAQQVEPGLFPNNPYIQSIYQRFGRDLNGY